jgi:hypothetical protein
LEADLKGTKLEEKEPRLEENILKRKIKNRFFIVLLVLNLNTFL